MWDLFSFLQETQTTRLGRVILCAPRLLPVLARVDFFFGTAGMVLPFSLTYDVGRSQFGAILS